MVDLQRLSSVSRSRSQNPTTSSNTTPIRVSPSSLWFLDTTNINCHVGLSDLTQMKLPSSLLKTALFHTLKFAAPQHFRPPMRIKPSTTLIQLVTDLHISSLHHRSTTLNGSQHKNTSVTQFHGLHLHIISFARAPGLHTATLEPKMLILRQTTPTTETLDSDTITET